MGKECSLGRLVRGGLVEGDIFRIRLVKTEGANHKTRLGMRLGEVGKNVSDIENSIANTLREERTWYI